MFLFSDRQRRCSGAPGLIAVILVIATTLLAPGVDSAAAMPSARTESACASPEIFSLLSTEDSPSTPDATPIASPVAVPGATPVAGDDAGQQANSVVAGQIDRSIRSIAVCQAAGRVKTLVKYVTTNYLSDVYASGGRITKDQFIILGRELPRVPVEILSVSNVRVVAPGRASADVVWTIGRQLFHAEWAFVLETQVSGDDTGEDVASGYWLADGATQLPLDIPDGANQVDIVIGNNRYKPSKVKVAGPDIVLSADNTGKADHELLVLKLDTSITTDSLLLDPGATFPKGVAVLGQLTIPAGKSGQLVLVGVEKGTYAIVDLLPDENGTPHLALGMEAVLTVR